MDLLERIQLANKRSEQNNRKSAEAQAQLKLLTKQISELVADYEQKFGISFPNIEDEAKFTKFVNDLLNQTEADLEKQVSLAEKVNQLILDGDIVGAQELLGYAPEEEPLEEAEVVDEVEVSEETAEEGTEVELSEVAPKRVIEEEPIVKPTTPVRRSPVVDFDELEDADDEPIVKPTRTMVVEDEEPIVAPKRRTVVEDEVPIVAPKRTRPMVNNDLDDLDEVPIGRPRKQPIVTSNFDMGEDEGVSLKELNEVAGVAPKGVSKPKSPIVTDELEEEEIPIAPRRRNILVDEDDDDAVAPARPVRSGGSFKFD